ncbi:hypothetical protein WR25_01395 isoform B [Diploscapter pachys]|uniref:Uncharacterized protein n=1 Tax=Diploscapter pachys TaxID=2018661 RepID=A0A2A2LMK0_9BILA|nr:hypothetical protein WR25_01395 isoform B [Diploscapter pachys]
MKLQEVLILSTSLSFLSINAQTWYTGDNSTVEGCSSHCDVTEKGFDCWNKTLAYFERTLIGQLRHYLAVQIDIDQWHRRHGQPKGQDYDKLASDTQAALLNQLGERDILSKETINEVSKSLTDRIKSVGFLFVLLLTFLFNLS